MVPQVAEQGGWHQAVRACFSFVLNGIHRLAVRADLNDESAPACDLEASGFLAFSVVLLSFYFSEEEVYHGGQHGYQRDFFLQLFPAGSDSRPKCLQVILFPFFLCVDDDKHR